MFGGSGVVAGIRVLARVGAALAVAGSLVAADAAPGAVIRTERSRRSRRSRARRSPGCSTRLRGSRYGHRNCETGLDAPERTNRTLDGKACFGDVSAIKGAVIAVALVAASGPGPATAETGVIRPVGYAAQVALAGDQVVRTEPDPAEIQSARA